jgi:UDP-N-acetylmuramate dehydrogenase
MLPEARTLLRHGVEERAFTDELVALPGKVRFDEPLGPRTTIGVGGNAAYFFSPESPLALKRAIELCFSYHIPYLVLGAGSNLLIADRGYSGLVISTERLRGVSLSETSLRAFAGEPLPALVNLADLAGNRSLNFLVGIPGSLGGAIAMNAGIPARAIGDVVEEVAVLGPDGSFQVLHQKDCRFTYRGSAIQSEELTVVWARLRLGNERYDKDALLARRRANQPLSFQSAGCVFKNPPALSAGRLIDEAGLKGVSVGMAKVSEEHANFIVNLGGATSAEIRKLIDIVRQKVYKGFRIWLEVEIKVIEG